jgi:hypothetical protein
MALSFTRVSLWIAVCVIGMVLATAFIIHPLLFPPEPAPWCCTYDHLEPIPIINWHLLLGPIMIVMGIGLMMSGFDTSEPEPAADQKKYCPCCGRKLE